MKNVHKIKQMGIVISIFSTKDFKLIFTINTFHYTQDYCSDCSSYHDFGHLDVFKNLLTPHERIHALGHELVKFHNAGQKEKAHEKYIEVHQTSLVVVGLLEKLFTAT